MVQLRKVALETAFGEMPAWRRRRLGVAITFGVIAGVLGAMQTFAYFRLEEFGAVVPLPQWSMIALAVLTGASLRPLTGSAWAASWAGIVASLVSLPAFYLFWMYPFIQQGYSVNLLLVYFAHVAGGQGLFSWVLFFPLTFAAGFMLSLPIADRYRM